MSLGRDVVKQAAVTLAAAVLAAWVVGNLPGVKAWLRKQWS
jgi:hypothetical protein